MLQIAVAKQSRELKCTFQNSLLMRLRGLLPDAKPAKKLAFATDPFKLIRRATSSFGELSTDGQKGCETYTFARTGANEPGTMFTTFLDAGKARHPLLWLPG